MAGMSGTFEMPVSTPRYCRFCGDATDIARSMEHEYLGVEHEILAILQDRHAMPIQVLGELAGLDEVESRLRRCWPRRATGRRARETDQQAAVFTASRAESSADSQAVRARILSVARLCRPE
jgi:Clp amino terminal domain, pathogenicity island component